MGIFRIRTGSYLVYLLGVSAAMLLGLASPAGSTAPEAELDAAPVADANSAPRRIGVISAAGDRLFQIHIGKLAFGNSEQSADILDWNLDDEWERQITTAARAQFADIEFVDLSIDRQPIYAAYPDTSGRSLIRKERYLDFDAAAPEFQRLAAAHDLEALVIVSVAFKHMDPIYVEGATLLTETTFVGANAYLWLVLETSYVDGETGKRLANRQIGKSGSIPERLPKELRAKRLPEYSAEDISFIQGRFQMMPEAQWPKAIRKLVAVPE